MTVSDKAIKESKESTLFSSALTVSICAFITLLFIDAFLSGA
jgi:hypothetical protein